MILSKDRILDIIRREGEVCFDEKDIVFPFSFKRMDGLAIMLAQTVYPSKSEEEVQLCPKWEMESNIKEWCSENNLTYHYDSFHRKYYFRSELNLRYIKQTSK